MPKPVETAQPLTEVIAEGLHKAMCYGPTTLHNRLACERSQVYLALAEAVVAHPATIDALRAEATSGAGAGLREADVTALAGALYETDPPESWMRTGTDEYRKRAAAMLDIIARDLAALAATSPQPTPELRAVLWNACVHDGKYGDDGEMQCHGADFLRGPLDRLVAHVRDARNERLGLALVGGFFSRDLASPQPTVEALRDAAETLCKFAGRFSAGDTDVQRDDLQAAIDEVRAALQGSRDKP